MKRLDQEPLADWTRRVLEDERAQWDPLTLRDALRAWLAEYGQRAGSDTCRECGKRTTTLCWPCACDAVDVNGPRP